MKIIPLGGLGEIGMNCMVLETDREILVIDCGLLFSDLEHLGIEFVIPDFSYLVERKDKIKAFIITHGHEDHIGAISFAIKAGIKAPIYASAFTARLIGERMIEPGLTDRVDVRVLPEMGRVEFEDFKVQTVPVNHSIIEACALIIDTPEGKIVHTGDFKIDPTPYYGKAMDLSVFKKAGDEGVLLLLSDSTNVERCDHSMSEKKVYNSLEQLMAASEGLFIISMFASNIGRMGQVLEMAAKQGKKVALAGRTMDGNARVAMECGYLKGAQNILIAQDQISDYPRNEVVLLATGSQGEFGSALSRLSQGEYAPASLLQGDQVVLSSKFIPGNEKAIGRTINALFKQGADVIYDAIHEVHVSGHVTRPELKLMLEVVRLKFFVLIHGEFRHLVHHSRLAIEAGVPEPQVLIAINGDVLELNPNSLRVTEHMEETRVLVEGRAGGDVSRLMIKERRNLAEKGVVFSLLVRNSSSRRIVAGPEIFAKGIVHEDQEGWLIEEGKKIVKKIVKKYEDALDHGESYKEDLQETIRIELRRFFNNNIGKKPTVVPIVLDV